MNKDPRIDSPDKIKPREPLPYISRRALRRVQHPLPPPEECRYCGGPVSLVSNAEIYGREYGDWPYAYLCRECWAYVGLHPHTDIPLGLMADRSLRRVRSREKPFFGRMTEVCGLTRSEAYEWLAEAMGLPKDLCHWAFFDVKQCLNAGEICRGVIDQVMQERALPDNILALWIELHVSMSDAAKDLSNLTGKQYRPHRLYEWRNGDRPLPMSVYQTLVRELAPIVFNKVSNLPRPQRDKQIKRLLSPPPPKAGR